MPYCHWLCTFWKDNKSDGSMYLQEEGIYINGEKTLFVLYGPEDTDIKWKGFEK